MTASALLGAKCLAIYLLAINLLAVILTAADKIKAKKGAWRIPEKTLLLFGALGGAAGEWLMMLLIRHKTKHIKFMFLLPLFTLVHLGLIVWLFLF